ncbi:hypothetical protein [Aliarcobacter butzleri]|uniref:hypothetical protein n=1 Tax=Aliarcobacter butzleri TaxID=28197 RepID=UPI00125F7059|nr:hypothetical protein [Aliarcobacter butzleri]
MKFGTKLKLKKDWEYNKYFTFEKDEILQVAIYEHKYGIKLHHPRITDLNECSYSKVFEVKRARTTKEMYDKAFEYFGIDKREDTVDDDLHCPKCKSTNVSCACFGENDGCNCRDCNHSFMIHD